MSRRKQLLDDWARRGKSPAALPNELPSERAKIDHVHLIQTLVASGYAGVDRQGMIVDRREYPDATPIQANKLLGVPKPHKIRTEHENKNKTR